MKQEFHFSYESIDKFEKFLGKISSQNILKKENDFFLITDTDESFEFLFSQENFGLLTDRSGDYFRFLGFFIDELTATFGDITIIDS